MDDATAADTSPPSLHAALPFLAEQPRDAIRPQRDADRRPRRRVPVDQRADRAPRPDALEERRRTGDPRRRGRDVAAPLDRKSTRLNSSHSQITYAVLCLKKNSS